MKRLTFISTAIAVGLAASFLIVAPTALSAIAGVVSPAARNEEQNPPRGNYLNVGAGYGSAELTFLGNGKYTYGDDGSVSAEGTYAIAGNQMTFIEYGPADASCLRLPGKYTWKLTGRVLALTEVADQCSTRQYDWGSGQWFKQR